MNLAQLKAAFIKAAFTEPKKEPKAYWGICRDGDKGLVALFGETSPYGVYGNAGTANNYKNARATVYSLTVLHDVMTRNGVEYLKEKFGQAYEELKAAEVRVAAGITALSAFPDFRTKDIEARKNAYPLASSSDYSDATTWVNQAGRVDLPIIMTDWDAATRAGVEGPVPAQCVILKPVGYDREKPDYIAIEANLS